jgi:DNA polymerase
VGEVTKDQRQIGKVAALALGHQGGKGAFLAMAKGYGVKVPEETAEEIKLAWRAANPEIVKFWYALENEARECMECPPGIFCPVGDYGLGFKRNNKAMALRLPGGRHLVYWWPKLELITTPWGATKRAVTYWAEDPVKNVGEVHGIWRALD